MTITVDETHTTVLKLLARGRDPEWVAQATGRKAPEVRDIGERYGWPDVEKVMAALTGAGIEDTGPRHIPAPGPRPTPLPARPMAQHTAHTPPTPALVDGDTPPATFATLLDRAADSPSKRTQALGTKIAALLTDLADRLGSDERDRKNKLAKEARRLKALAAVRELEEQLADARAAARALSKHGGGDGPARVARSTTPAAQFARSRAGTATNAGLDYATADVRAWAKEHGVDCPARGRFLPQDVVKAWREATTTETRTA